MTMHKKIKRPSIHMIDAEADTLANLAIGAEERLPQVSELLQNELTRAKIYSAKNIPPDVVTMNAVVEFLDESSGVTRTVKLVFPGDADISNGRISILTPIGAGLIGLRQGQSILWPDREGKGHTLTIISVAQTPPRT
jgi:regulator of nucleoside diphosphate kinase